MDGTYLFLYNDDRILTSHLSVSITLPHKNTTPSGITRSTEIRDARRESHYCAYPRQARLWIHMVGCGTCDPHGYPELLQVAGVKCCLTPRHMHYTAVRRSLDCGEALIRLL